MMTYYSCTPGVNGMLDISDDRIPRNLVFTGPDHKRVVYHLDEVVE